MSGMMPTRIETGPNSHPRAAAILVIGIVSITFMPVLRPVAWAIGRSALREIDAAPSRYSNRSTVQVGMILGIVATVFLIVGLALVVTIIVWATTGDGLKHYDVEAATLAVSALRGR